MPLPLMMVMPHRVAILLALSLALAAPAASLELPSKAVLDNDAPRLGNDGFGTTRVDRGRDINVAGGSADDLTIMAPGAPATRTIAQEISDTIIATRFSAPTTPVDPTGSLDSTAGVQAAIDYAQRGARGLSTVVLPCGIYKISATWRVSVSNMRVSGANPGCVRVDRSGDFGPSILFSNPGGTLTNAGLFNVNFLDNAATTGAAGYSTCENSPYQVVVDGANGFTMAHVQVSYGCGGIALKGVVNAHVLRPDIGIYPIPGHPEMNGQGVGFYVGYSTNANLSVKYSSGVWIADLEIEGGSLSVVNGVPAPVCKLQDGVLIDGQDGTFSTNSHVQCTTQADYHLAHRGPYPNWNISFTSMFADISSGHGILMDGSAQLNRVNLEGRVSAATAGGANSHGVYNFGSGGASLLTMDLSIDGYKGGGIRFEGTNLYHLTIRPRQIHNNNLGRNPDGTTNGYCAIDIAQAYDLSIVGGAVGGDGTVSCAIKLGSAVNFATVSGVNGANTANYGLIVAGGANNIIATGNNFAGNPSGAVADLTPPGTVKLIRNNLGQPDP